MRMSQARDAAQRQACCWRGKKGQVPSDRSPRCTPAGFIGCCLSLSGRAFVFDPAGRPRPRFRGAVDCTTSRTDQSLHLILVCQTQDEASLARSQPICHAQLPAVSVKFKPTHRLWLALCIKLCGLVLVLLGGSIVALGSRCSAAAPPRTYPGCRLPNGFPPRITLN